ncbi:MAG TPA: hypothetical protein VEB86_06460 [Chryseosolibacter sp.]|nr:hypothetical protein [Chryseosolibacter sp.]
MKKVIALLMVCGFALAFVACGEKKAAENTEATETETPATTDTTTTDTTTTDTTGAAGQ